MRPKITEAERLQLENQALRQIVQEFAAMVPVVREGTEEHLQRLILKARNRLQAIARQKKTSNERDPLVTTCGRVVHYSRMLIRLNDPNAPDPVVCLDRLGPRSWEAYLEDREEWPAGTGKTPVEAVQRLVSSVKQAWQRQSKNSYEV